MLQLLVMQVGGKIGRFLIDSDRSLVVQKGSRESCSGIGGRGSRVLFSVLWEALPQCCLCASDSQSLLPALVL